MVVGAPHNMTVFNAVLSVFCLCSVTKIGQATVHFDSVKMTSFNSYPWTWTNKSQKHQVMYKLGYTTVFPIKSNLGVTF